MSRKAKEASDINSIIELDKKKNIRRNKYKRCIPRKWCNYKKMG